MVRRLSAQARVDLLQRRRAGAQVGLAQAVERPGAGVLRRVQIAGLGLQVQQAGHQLALGGATLLAIMGGYALAKFRFPGRKAVFVVIIGAISVPGIALAVPQFLLFAKLGLTNTPWAMIIPSLISPFGLYLMWIFSEQAVPQELLEAARVDGASEFRTFWQISLPLLAPGIVTTALFTIVATWNNYFLPLIMLKDSNWYPLTIGLNQWKDQASTAGGQAIQNLVVTGSLITIVPLVIAFLCLQKYWQSGLAAGAVKE